MQEGEFERVGGSQTLKVDVRLVAATNRDSSVRELQNVIERAVILSPSGRFVLADVLSTASTGVSPKKAAQSLEEVERQHIVAVLEETGWRVSGERGAATILGLKRTTLEARMRKLGIHRPS